jgi:predicted transcriptional regulator
MPATSIRLPDELKQRIDALAAATGKTVHAFMLDALAETAESMEQQQAFEAEAERRWVKYQRTGQYITLEDMRVYAKGLAAGTKPPKPKVRVDVARKQAAKRA